MINFNRGQYYNANLDPDNSILKDANSTWLLYSRWIFLVNQISWICVGNGLKELMPVAVGISTGPSLLLLFYENIIYFWRTDDFYLNSLGFLLLRVFFSIYSTVGIVSWYALNIEPLIVSVWICLFLMTFLEMMVACVQNDKCPNMCKERNYYQIG